MVGDTVTATSPRADVMALLAGLNVPSGDDTLSPPSWMLFINTGKPSEAGRQTWLEKPMEIPG